jgi:hypothetical protein
MFDTNAIIAFKYFENTLECSGLCKPLGYYIFTDVNKLNQKEYILDKY